MRKVIRLLVLAIIATTCILSACTKDNFDMDRLSGEVVYDGSYAIPLVYSDLSLLEVMGLLNDTVELRENDGGFLSLFYNAEVETKMVQDLLNLGDVSYSKTISIADFASRGTRDNSLSYNGEEKISFTLKNEGVTTDEAEIDSLVLNSGIFEYELSSTFGQNLSVSVEFPSITKNGQPLMDSFTLNAQNTTASRTVTIEGYNIDFTTTSKHFNEIPIKYNVSLSYGGAIPPASGALSVNVRIGNFKYKSIHGYFGKNSLLLQSDTIEVKLFREKQKYHIDDFYFNDPKIKVHYWNSYGVPSRFYFQQFDTYMKKLDVVYDVATQNPDFPMSALNPYDVAHSSTPGVYAEDSIFIDRNNSNLDDIVPNRPTWFHFCAVAETNPDNPSHERNFISEDSKLKARVSVEFPLWGRVGQFYYNDTVDVDVSSIVGNNYVERMAVLINTDNGLPVDSRIQFYVADENYNVMDSLVKDTDAGFLTAAPLDANGRVASRISTQTKIELTREQVDKMSDCKHILIRIFANTEGAYEAKTMKIYPEYGIKFNVGLEVDFDVEGNINSGVNKKVVATGK